MRNWLRGLWSAKSWSNSYHQLPAYLLNFKHGRAVRVMSRIKYIKKIFLKDFELVSRLPATEQRMLETGYARHEHTKGGPLCLKPTQPAIIQRARAAPESLTRGDVLQLQRTIGNRADYRVSLGEQVVHTPAAIKQDL